MNENCRAFKEETNELANLLIGEMGNPDAIVEMSTKEFESTKLMIKLVKTSGDLIGDLAESLGRIERKLDELLKKTNKKEA